MTKLLRKQNVKPAYGETFDGYNVHLLGSSQFEEISTQFTVPYIANPCGQNTRVELTWASGEVYKIDELYMTWLATNSSATEAPTFKNVFELFGDVKLLINKKELFHLKDRHQIRAAVGEYLRCQHPIQIYQTMQRWRAETGTSFAGETVPVSGTKYWSVPLTVLFPFLKSMQINKGIDRLEFEINFAPDLKSIQNGSFVLSNTANNAYSTNLTYSNIRLKTILSRHTDSRLYIHTLPVSLPMSKWETRQYTQAWNTVGTDMIQIDISTAWSKRTKCTGILVFAQPIGNITAYNDTDCCKFYSGANYFGYRVLSRSREILNHSQAVEHLQDRYRYSLDTQRKRFGNEFPQEIITGSTDLGKLYMFETYIDLANVEVLEDDEIPVSGVSNFERDIEIELWCTGALGTNVNIFTMLNYVEIGSVNEKTKAVEILK